MSYSLGGRVTLRPITEDDADLVVLWRNRDRGAFFNTDVVTPDTHREFMRHRKLHDLVWVAMVTPCEPVGMVGLAVDVQAARAEFGRSYVDVDHRRQGLGTEIMYMALSYGFDVLYLCSVWLLVRSSNKASLGLDRKAHWVEEPAPESGRVLMTYSRALWETEGRQRARELVGGS